MRLRTLLTYLSLLPLGACTKSCDDYDNAAEFNRAQLPPYTETGAHTMGCRLGPQVWTVLGHHDAGRAIIGGTYWEKNELWAGPFNNFLTPPRVPLLQVMGRMTGVRDSKAFYDMELNMVFHLTDTLGGLRLLGTDTARATTGIQPEAMWANDYLSFSNDYRSRTRRPVRLQIRRLDRQQRIVSGTFEGWLYGGPGGNDSLEVADGRFDVKY
ncbi:hypothetical protein [Hymenobacter saemangeumensis]